MFETYNDQLLAGMQGLPMPQERDPKGVLTPDPPACPDCGEGEGLASGHVTPTYATLAGRGLLYQKLCEGVSAKLRQAQEQQWEPDREELGGQSAPASSGQAARSWVAGAPSDRQSTELCLGELLPPESWPQQAAPATVPPLPAVPPPPGLAEPSTEVVSIGSLGHPFTCKEACKYQKRKTGCLLGAACPRCHLCHWHRKGKEAAQPAAEQNSLPRSAVPPTPPPPPVATHPRWAAPWQAASHSAAAAGAQTQAPPPRTAFFWEEPAYVTMSSGVAEGAAASAVAAATSANEAPAEPGASCSFSPFPSAGSIGHPHACGRACKYAGKANGCKVGYLCNRCHLCRWTRSKEHGYAAGLL